MAYVNGMITWVLVFNMNIVLHLQIQYNWHNTIAAAFFRRRLTPRAEASAGVLICSKPLLAISCTCHARKKILSILELFMLEWIQPSCPELLNFDTVQVNWELNWTELNCELS